MMHPETARVLAEMRRRKDPRAMYEAASLADLRADLAATAAAIARNRAEASALRAALVAGQRLAAPRSRGRTLSPSRSAVFEKRRMGDNRTGRW